MNVAKRMSVPNSPISRAEIGRQVSADSADRVLRRCVTGAKGRARPARSLRWRERCAWLFARLPPRTPLKLWGSKGLPALGGVSGQCPEKPGTGFRAHGFAPVTTMPFVYHGKMAKVRPSHECQGITKLGRRINRARRGRPDVRHGGVRVRQRHRRIISRHVNAPLLGPVRWHFRKQPVKRA